MMKDGLEEVWMVSSDKHPEVWILAASGEPTILCGQDLSEIAGMNTSSCISYFLLFFSPQISSSFPFIFIFDLGLL